MFGRHFRLKLGRGGVRGTKPPLGAPMSQPGNHIDDTSVRKGIVVSSSCASLRPIFAALFLLLCAFAYSQTPRLDLTAPEALRAAVQGELKAQSDDHSHWMYQVRTNESGKEVVKLVVETKDGELDRLRYVDGQPITAEQEIQEDRRIENLLHSAEKQRKRQRAQAEDADQTARMFRVLPEALSVRYGERRGDLVELLFEPNPNFHAWSREAMVFHEMEGLIWVNVRANRLAEIQGHLIKTVKFGGGLLGYLDK